MKKLYTYFSAMLLLAVFGTTSAMAQLAEPTYKTFTETTVFYTTLANMQQAYAEGWVADGTSDKDGYVQGKFSSGKASKIVDPENEPKLKSTAAGETVGIKKNEAKCAYFYVKGVSAFKAYVSSTGAAGRLAQITATPVGGEPTIVAYENTEDKNYTLEISLDAKKEYELLVNVKTGDDMLLGAVKFTVSEGGDTPEPEMVQANSLVTFSSAKAVAIPAGLEAYCVVSVAGDVANLGKLSGAIPANCGVILRNTTDAALACPAEEATAEPVSGNMLVATGDGVDAKSGDYVLATVDGVQAFHPLKADGKLKANKAYLPAASTTALAALRLNFEEATVIQAVQSAECGMQSAVFNLAGQKVGAGYKGIVIKNGKKMLVK